MAHQSIQTVVNDIVVLSQQTSQKGGHSSRGQSNQALISKATELVAVAQSPIDRALSLLAAVVEPAVIRTLMTLKVLDAVPSPPASITLADLAISTGVQTSLLARLLRIVTSTGFLRHVEEKETELSYMHSATSQAFSEGVLGTVFAALYDGLLTTTVLPEYFKSHDACEPDGDDAMTRNPQTWRHG